MFFSHAKRIWIAYSAILLLVAVVLGWFSWFTVRLDRDAEQNRREVLMAEQEAARQERIGRALWQIDWALSPLVAQEAARTHWMYQSFLPESEGLATPPGNSKAGKASTGGSKGGMGGGTGGMDGMASSSQQPSPLLMRPSPWVLLHFQVGEDGKVTSPQSPQGKTRIEALQCGVSEKELGENQVRLNEIASAFKFEPLWSVCSKTMLTQDDSNNLAWALPPSNDQILGNNNVGQRVGPPELVDNNLTQAAEQQSLQSQQQVALPQQAIKRGNTRSQATDYLQRGQTTNNAAAGQWQMNRFNFPFPTSLNESAVTEGALRPVWLDSRLVLVRRVESPLGKRVQGCWLDWPTIKKSLLQEIADILPGADLVARAESDQQIGASLATLPVDLVAPIATLPEIELTTSGSRVVVLLWLVWGGFFVAAISLGWLIWGVTQLSERRAAFASAVTHELRTPLTTFKLYSEMLASNMVRDESQRQAYATGLVQESDRLCRLVENVLQFARLERKQNGVLYSKLTVEQLLQNTIQRCQARVETSSMKLEINIATSENQAEIQTSADLVDQIVFNLVDNACKYACESQRSCVDLSVNFEGKWLMIRVRDYGPGIDAQTVKRLFQPFSRSSDETAGTAAGVGLGLSLSRQLAKQLRGRLEYRPANPGCIFELRLPL